MQVKPLKQCVDTVNGETEHVDQLLQVIALLEGKVAAEKALHERLSDQLSCLIDENDRLKDQLGQSETDCEEFKRQLAELKQRSSTYGTKVTDVLSRYSTELTS